MSAALRKLSHICLHSEKNESVWQSLASNTEETKELLTVQLKRLSDELSRCFRSEANLEFRYSDNRIIEDVYDLARMKQVAKRKSIEEQIKSIKTQLDSLSDSSDFVSSVVELRKKFLTDIASFDNQQWRDILIMLDCRILVSDVKPAVMAGNVAYREHGWLDSGIETSKQYLKEREKIGYYFHIPIIGHGFTAILLLMMPKLISTDGFRRIALRKPARVKSIRLYPPTAAGAPPAGCDRIRAIHLKRARRGGSS